MRDLSALILFAALSLPVVAHAADPGTEQLVRPAARAMFQASGAPGMVIAVVRDDTVLIDGYGETVRGNGRKPGADTLLRVGSLSKTMTADVLSKLVVDGTVRLTDPLQVYAPAGARVPVLNGAAPITLLNLATHTAGLKRSSDGKRWEWLATQVPDWAPGTGARYSNVGFQLLADALGEATRRPYDELLRQKLTAPLGMSDTTAKPTKEQCRRLMSGADADPCGDASNVAGTAGMYSTASDLVKWMQVLSGVKLGDPAVRKVQQAVYFPRQQLSPVEGLDIAGPAAGVGLGWIHLQATATTPAILEKTGGGAGYMCYLAFLPERRVGVFVLVNKADAEVVKTLAPSVNALVAVLDRR